jgi:nucleotide-binding universal stress UspA family protein
MTNNELIVVGVDGSEGSRRALRWAVTEARHTNAAVEAITAWYWDGADMAMLAATNPREQFQHAERISAREVDAIVTELGSATPIAREVVEGYPVAALVEASRRARLLVLGSHGYGRLHHAVLGSVSDDCVRHAQCPVVIIPAHTPQPAEQAAEPVPAP